MLPNTLYVLSKITDYERKEYLVVISQGNE